MDFTHEAEISYDDFCKVELRVAEAVSYTHLDVYKRQGRA